MALYKLPQLFPDPENGDEQFVVLDVDALKPFVVALGEAVATQVVQTRVGNTAKIGRGTTLYCSGGLPAITVRAPLAYVASLLGWDVPAPLKVPSTEPTKGNGRLIHP